MVWVSSLKIVKGQIVQKVMLDKTRCNFFSPPISESFTVFPWHLSHKTLGKAYFFTEESRCFFVLDTLVLMTSYTEAIQTLGFSWWKGFQKCLWFCLVVIKLEQITQVSSKLNQSLLSVHWVLMLMETLNKRTLFFPLVNILRRIDIIILVSQPSPTCKLLCQRLFVVSYLSLPPTQV